MIATSHEPEACGTGIVDPGPAPTSDYLMT
jgi:hypothetical protein